MDKNVFYSHLKKYLPDEEITKLRFCIENTNSIYNSISVDVEKINLDDIKSIYPDLKKDKIKYRQHQAIMPEDTINIICFTERRLKIVEFFP